MERARDEFPERFEILKGRAVRVVMVRGRVMHVGGQPHRVADAGAFHERQQIGDLMLAPLRRAIAERDRVLADQADRHVGGDHLPGRVGGHQFALQPRQLCRAEDESVAVVVALVPGIVAVAAHVEHEDVEQWTVADPAIDATVIACRLSHRHEFVERAPGPRHQFRDAVLGKAALVVAAQRRPVVGHLVIVPLREHRDLGVEGAKVLVEPVVFIVAAKLRETVRDDRFFFRHDVAPDLAVRQLQLGGDGTVGIDVIAGMNEEVWPVVAHGPVGPHAAARGIDAPALACGVARPDERHRTTLRRRGTEMPDPGFSGEAACDVVEAHAIEDILPCGQAIDQRFRSEVAVRQRIG